MSTTDVPGVKDSKGKSKHNDELSALCWAEHDDGSMIFVESVEDGRVVYSVFDFKDEIIEYRDSMSVHGFKKAFSYDASDDDSIRWTWHDKTPFPWDRVIEQGARAGGRHAHADHLMSAAERVAKSRSLHRRKFDYNSALTRAGSIGAAIVDKVQRAIRELRK